MFESTLKSVYQWPRADIARLFAAFLSRDEVACFLENRFARDNLNISVFIVEPPERLDASREKTLSVQQRSHIFFQIKYIRVGEHKNFFFPNYSRENIVVRWSRSCASIIFNETLLFYFLRVRKWTFSDSTAKQWHRENGETIRKNVLPCPRNTTRSWIGPKNTIFVFFL